MSGLVVLGVALVAIRSSSAQVDELDALTVCKDTQKLLFENALVRVIDDVIPPDGREAKHRHPHGLLIAMTESDNETTTYPAGRTVRSHSKFGAVSWSEPLIHETHNVGSAASHFIRIDLK